MKLFLTLLVVAFSALLCHAGHEEDDAHAEETIKNCLIFAGIKIGWYS